MTTTAVPDVLLTSARVLDALADSTRAKVLCLLGGRGRMSVGDIAAHFPMSRPAVSHHLKVMLDAGLVLNEKAGQEVYYWVNCDSIVKALRGLADAIEVCCHGGQCCASDTKDTTEEGVQVEEAKQ
ncbi:MAG: metalloregulator ArsR/SmtB family transcription factor [Chloroflexota bacterium]